MGSVPSFLDQEKSTWQVHSLGIDKALAQTQRQLVDRFGTTLCLCFRESTYMGLSYQHYFIIDAECRWVIEFGGGELSNAAVNVHCSPVRDFSVYKRFDRTPEVTERMKKVCGARSYSLCLRNCEHLARYIHTGSWLSLQMIEKGAIYTFLYSYMEACNQGRVNSFPRELEPAPIPQHVVWPESACKRMALFRRERPVLSQEENSFRVVVLGPTGAGKSGFINALFNWTVANSKPSARSVTQQVNIYEGERVFDDGSRRIVHVFDCLGFCDSQLSTAEVLATIKQKIKVSVCSIDSVVIITSGRIEAAHTAAITQAMDWLKFKTHVSNFVFLYNKSENLTEKEKLEAIATLRSQLQVPADDLVFSRDHVSVPNVEPTVFDPRRGFEEVRLGYFAHLPQGGRRHTQETDHRHHRELVRHSLTQTSPG